MMSEGERIEGSQRRIYIVEIKHESVRRGTRENYVAWNGWNNGVIMCLVIV